MHVSTKHQDIYVLKFRCVTTFLPFFFCRKIFFGPAETSFHSTFTESWELFQPLHRFTTLSWSFRETIIIKTKKFKIITLIDPNKNWFNNRFQSSVAFHIETSNLIWSENQVIGFYIKRSTRLKWVKTDFLGPKKLFVYLRTDKLPPSTTPKSVFQESSGKFSRNLRN